MPSADDFAAFEAEVADVPNAFEELPGVRVPLSLVEHLVEILQHFTLHTFDHMMEARSMGLQTVSYPTVRGATIHVTTTELAVNINYSISPDLAETLRREMNGEDEA